MTEANKRQVGGSHYKKSGVLEHWDLVAIYNWDYFQARTIAYVMRWREKGGIQDLEKARHFLDKYIELETLRAKGTLSMELIRASLIATEALLDKEEIQYNVNPDDPYHGTIFDAGPRASDASLPQFPEVQGAGKRGGPQL
jgi:hypothetical protein